MPFRKAFAFSLFTAGIMFGQTNVLTQHNDIARTGQNLSEFLLTPSSVSSANFGKKFTLPVDGQIYAQPLYMSKVAIAGQVHHVVFVATEHDSVYAFDATAPGAPLWKASLLDAAHGAAPGATSDPESDTGCADIAGPEYGITGTPVIDPVSGTLFVVSLTLENGYPVQRLHALDITTGREKNGSPTVIAAQVHGTGSGSSGGILAFDPKWENQRAGLLLLNGTVYIGYASHCDSSVWHGWILGYDAATLLQTGAFVTTPNGSSSGVWMAGSGLAADVVGGIPRMFPATGNGSFNATAPYGTNTMNYGDDILRLDLSNGIHVADAFTPSAQGIYSFFDLDVGSGGVLVLPDQFSLTPHLAVQVGKSGAMYLVNRDKLGGYSLLSNAIVQQVSTQGLWGMPAYWNQNVYVWGWLGRMSQFKLTNGRLSTSPVATGPQLQTSNGSTPSISAYGFLNGIVWSVDNSGANQVLYAYDANNVANVLWTSAQNAARDAGGPVVKFVVPTVADGNVFLGSATQLTVYGMLK